jgi:nicotinamidase-related amidase
VIDAQTALLQAVDQAARLENNIRILLTAARTLGVPVTFSEQYPAGLGPTAPGLREAAPAAPSFEKLAFSALRDPSLRSHLIGSGSQDRQFVLCGTEAHVCVLQTGLDLLQSAAGVFVVADAVSSRTPENRAFGLERLSRAGAGVVTTEMVLFEWLERAGDDNFRALSKLVR